MCVNSLSLSFTHRNIVHRPREIGSGLRKLAAAISPQLIARSIARHDAFDEWLRLWDICNKKTRERERVIIDC
jgi:hypothetical protein